MMLLFRMLLVLLLAFSLEACEPVTKWSITGGEFHLKHKICKEIPGNGALKIAVPTGFDLSNSNITKQEPKGWTLTENGTTIKLVTSNTIPANTSIEITMSEANAPAHYMAPFYEEFTEFGAVVSKKGLDCAKCTGTGGNIPSSPVNCEMSDWGNWSDCSVSCGAGNKTKTRTVTTQPENGGTACLALKDTETCNEGDCPCPVLVALRNVSTGHKPTFGKPYVPPLAEQDGWKDFTCDTSLKTMRGKLAGVTIDQNGMVTDIDLSETGLEGPVPDFSNNTALQELRLFNNKMTGTIPDFSKNTALEYLDISNNKCTGPLPDFSKNTALKELYLRSNKLSGPVPDFSKNTALKELSLSSNKLSGEIGDFSKNVNLVELWLNDNDLTGTEEWQANKLNYPSGCTVKV